MASFKILLVVALVAFIGSSGKKWNIYLFNIYFPKNNIFVIFLDALKCMVKEGANAAVSKVCAGGEKSCVVTAKISKYLHLWKEISLRGEPKINKTFQMVTW